MPRPDVFCVNNYGNVSAHDGSDVDADRGLLVKYQWHMPLLVLGLAAGERSGLSFTITIRDKAFNFETVAPTASQDDIDMGAIENGRAESVA